MRPGTLSVSVFDTAFWLPNTRHITLHIDNQIQVDPPSLHIGKTNHDRGLVIKK